ncbi:UNVERIFIED_CONTAM: hypothetical protein GTU68_056887, partial [Idotea baltica]|nr:hypothetical protein [Idotea baltica]
MIAVQSEEEASAFIVENIEARRPIWILGGGSNILFTKDFNGVVLKNEIMGREILHEDESEVIVRFGAGENWHEIVLHCIEQGWGGIENLSLIPGCVGAAPIQNIGAYGVEIKNVLEKVETIHLSTGRPRLFSVEDCALGYRDSFFKRVG